MPITVRADLHYKAVQPCELLLQIEAAQSPSQRCIQSMLTFTPDPGSHLIDGQGGVGTRRWINETRVFKCHYEATFDVRRAPSSFEHLLAANISQTPTQVTEYLLPSRYCHPEAFYDVLSEHFGNLSGGALVAAVSNLISETFSYDNTASTATTTATESFARRAGVCRDYAHVLIAMVRAAGIPARYVSVYAPDVVPQDFHAVAEVFLGGAWHLVDTTGMARTDDLIRIGVGRDAADAAFLISYGFITLINQTVDVSRTVTSHHDP